MCLSVVTRSGGIANNSESLLEKLLGCFPIPFLAQTRIHQVAVGINGTIQVTPFSPHLHVGFIHIPRWSCLSVPFGPQVVGNEWSKPHFPCSNCLVAERYPSFQASGRCGWPCP